MIEIRIVIDAEADAEKIQRLIEAVKLRAEMEFSEVTGKMNSPIRVSISVKDAGEIKP